MFNVIDTPCDNEYVKSEKFFNHLVMYETLCKVCAEKQIRGNCKYNEHCIDYCDIATACELNSNEFQDYIDGNLINKIEDEVNE